MDRFRFQLLALLLSVTSALAGSSSSVVPLNISATSSCVFDGANSSPGIDLNPAYQAGNIPSGSQGQVSVAVYCNKGTVLTGRTLIGSTSTSTPNAHIRTVLTQFSPGTSDTINAETWFTAGSSSPVPSGLYRGATRTVTIVNAGWPTTAQFGASTGFYLGDVSLVISF